MKGISLFTTILLALALVFALASCAPEDKGNTSPSLIINRSTVSMTVGDTYTLKTGITPAKYQELEVSWTNSNESVVKCEDGRLTALSVGSAVIEASIETGDSFTCRVEVKESLGNLYVVEGSSIEIDKSLFNGYFDSVNYVSTNEQSVSVSENEGKLVLNALAEGSSLIKLASGTDSIEYRRVVVLSDETYGVSVTLPDTPVRVLYQREGFSTQTEVYEIDIEKNAAPEYLASGFVKVKITFKYKKVNDSDGVEATNPFCFDFEIYSGQTEGVVRAYRVLKGSIAVSDAEQLEYTYTFDAMLDTGDGNRDFTIVIPELSS